MGKEARPALVDRGLGSLIVANKAGIPVGLQRLLNQTHHVGAKGQ